MQLQGFFSGNMKNCHHVDTLSKKKYKFMYIQDNHGGNYDWYGILVNGSISEKIIRGTSPLT